MTGRRNLNQTFAYLATIVLGQGMSFLILPFVTRLLPPEAYGQYALALTVSNLVAMIASSWIRNVGLRLYFDAVERGTTRGFFLGSTALQALAFAVLYAAMLAVFQLVGYELAPLRVLISAGITILLGDQFTYVVTLLRAEQRVGPYAMAEIGSAMLRFGVTLLGLTAGIRTPEILFDAASVGYLIGAVYAMIYLSPRLVGPARVDVAATLEIMRYGPRSLPFSVSGWFERLADRLVIEHFLGTVVVGVYSVGYTLGERLIGALTQGVFMMAWPSILKAWSDGGTREARRALADAQRLFAWLTIGPVTFLIAYGTTLTELLTGAEYHDAAVVVPLVAISMWLGGFGSYLNRHMELRKRFGTLSSITAIGAVVNVVLNVALVPGFGMMGAATATLANRMLNTAIFFVLRDSELTQVAVRPFAAAMGLAVAAYGLSAWLPVAAEVSMVIFVGVYAGVTLWVLLRSRSGRASDEPAS